MIRDVVAFPDGSFACADDELRNSFPPIRARIRIFDDVYAEKANREIWQRTYKACTLIGHSDAVPQFRQLYTFVRELRADLGAGHKIIWDHDERLQICLALSRLVHPTNISCEYSARFYIDEGRTDRVIPGPAKEFGSRAWISNEHGRNWLSIDEAGELARIVDAYYQSESRLPRRTKQAFWYLEYAFRTEFLDVRWPLICIGLESLVHTDRSSSTRQFSRRVSQLANELDICDFPSEKAKEVYETRCALAHGQLFRDLSPYNLDLYDLAESTLRLVLKKVILDPDYAQRFVSEESIREAYPIG